MTKKVRLFTRQEWIWLLLCALILGISSWLKIPNFTSLLMKEFSTQLAFIAGTFLIFSILAMGSGILAGALSDLFGSRPVLRAGTILAASGIGLAALGQYHSVFIRIFGIFSGIGFSFFVIPLTSLILRSSLRRTALALALLTLGGGGTSALIQYLENTAQESFGPWKSYIVFPFLFGIALAVLLTLIHFLREDKELKPALSDTRGIRLQSQKPAILPKEAFGIGAILKSRVFWMVFGSVTLSYICFQAFSFQITSFFIIQDIPRKDVTLAHNLMRLAGPIGIFGSALLVDRFGGKRILTVSVAMAPFSFLLLMIFFIFFRLRLLFISPPC